MKETPLLRLAYEACTVGRQLRPRLNGMPPRYSQPHSYYSPGEASAIEQVLVLGTRTDSPGISGTVGSDRWILLALFRGLIAGADQAHARCVCDHLRSIL